MKQILEDIERSLAESSRGNIEEGVEKLHDGFQMFDEGMQAFLESLKAKAAADPKDRKVMKDFKIAYEAHQAVIKMQIDYDKLLKKLHRVM